MAEILINGEPFYYEKLAKETHFFDKEIAVEFLSILKEVFDKHSIMFFLNCGTLLGAYREHDFIAHDFDMDLGIFEKDLDTFYQLIPELDQRGVKLCRVWGTIFFTFIYKKVICDFNVYYKAGFPYKYFFYGVAEGKYVPKKYLSEFVLYDFQGNQYYIPKSPEKYLEMMYGKDWRTPIKGKPGDSIPKWMVIERLYRKVKRKIRFLKCKYVDHKPFE